MSAPGRSTGKRLVVLLGREGGAGEVVVLAETC